jgi:two-component system, OmpR family, phosphate regulon response regulator OmpR
MAEKPQLAGARMSDSKPHILVIDDDRRIRELLQSYLAESGFRVSVAPTAAVARDKMRGLAFDLLVLDVMMPGESGTALAQSLRGTNEHVPILMLSALSEIEDRINGLMAGSDDYLPKPFEPRELLLRVQNLLRRAAPVADQRIDVRFGECLFNMPRGELRKSGELVKLTTRERELLRVFIQNAGRPITRAELAPGGAEENARTVDVQINRLRQKIEDDPSNPVYLQTVRGAGYTLHID